MCDPDPSCRQNKYIMYLYAYLYIYIYKYEIVKAHPAAAALSIPNDRILIARVRAFAKEGCT